MSIYFDDSELRKPAVAETVPDNERTLELQSGNAKRWLFRLIEEMSLEQRFRLLDHAQAILTGDGITSTPLSAEKVNVLRAIEQASRDRSEEPLSNLIGDIMKPQKKI